MKTELKMSEHGDGDVEIWYNGALIGQVTGSERGWPGVQVISHHPMLPQWHANEYTKRVEIRIASEPPSAQPFPPPRSVTSPSWLHNALHKATRPKQSIIGVLKQQLGGPQPGRSMEVLHASDVTKPDFCPRKWALFDLLEKEPPMDTIATAMDVTYQMGLAAETLLVEEWAGDAVVGNWRCRLCKEQRSMVPKPTGCCSDRARSTGGSIVQMVIEAPEYGIQGGIGCVVQYRGTAVDGDRSQDNEPHGV